jgi:FixJ family two-component response regulator
MPGMTGPELQRELKVRQKYIPIVFMTAKRSHADCEEVMREGAVECLSKPFSDTSLLNAINTALGTR